MSVAALKGPDAQSERRALLMAALAPVLVLLPFIFKPFHVDDPLYIWLAQNLLEDPIHFYDWELNWSGHAEYMYDIIHNPPAHGYFIAAGALLFGWSEVALHLVCLIPAVVASVGVYLLARRLCDRPMLALLLCIFCPAYLVSGTTIMTDMLFLAVYVWPIYIWMRGLETRDWRLTALAAFLIGCGFLVKYMELTLVPLLIAYTLAYRKRFCVDLLFLAFPLAVLAAYHFVSTALFGESLMASTLDLATGYNEDRSLLELLTRFTVNLSFAGGCLASATFFIPLLWEDKKVMLFPMLVAAIGGVLFSVGHFDAWYFDVGKGMRWDFLLESALWISAGIFLLTLAAAHLWKRRDHDSLLLFLWLIGVFTFCGFVNWSINGRTLIVAAPVTGILVVRMLEDKKGKEPRQWAVPAAVCAAAALAFAVAWGDTAHAIAYRESVDVLRERSEGMETKPVFQGHWGFQYYMEEAGFEPFDLDAGSRPGDVMIIPPNNDFRIMPTSDIAREIDRAHVRASTWVATLHRGVGAGFHTHYWGPLPFFFGRVPDEEFLFMEIGFYDDDGNPLAQQPSGSDAPALEP